MHKISKYMHDIRNLSLTPGFDKNVKRTSTAIAAFIIIFVVMMPKVFTFDNIITNMAMSMAEFCITGPAGMMLDVMSGRSSGSGINDSSMLAGAWRAFVGSSENGWWGGSNVGGLESVYSVIKGVGTVWMMIVAFSKLFTDIEKGKDPQETVYMTLIYMALTGLFINNLDKIMYLLGSLGATLVSDISHAGEGAGASSFAQLFQNMGLGGDLGLTGNDFAWADGFGADTVFEGITGKDVADVANGISGIIFGFQAILIMIIPFFGALICMLILRLKLLSTIIEVAIRRFFAPLAVVDIFQEGMRSSGVRYLKKYVGVYVKIAMMVLIVLIGGALSSLNTALYSSKVGTTPGLEILNFFIFMMDNLVIQMMMYNSMSSAEQIANDVLGA